MKRNILTILLLTLALGAPGQALRDLNYNYRYNPESKINFLLKPVKQADGWKILYSLQVEDTTALANIVIQWYGYDALHSKEGTDISSLTSDEEKYKTSSGITGSVFLEKQDAPKIIVARVIDLVVKEATLFFATLDGEYPVNNYLVSENLPVVRSFVRTGSQARFGVTEGTWIVSYYSHVFPPAAPAFSESQARVQKDFKPDSVYTLRGTDNVSFFKNGLYFFQHDTSSTEGFSVRASDDYPRFNKVQNLAGPFIYICTKEEYDQLELAKGDKRTFDGTVLGITKDEDRARELIKNYFRRVELANQYFSSYKEGWKTDRGMIYIVYGLPDNVFKFYDREVWEYKSPSLNLRFSFTKSSSVFDPDNYVLIRDKKFQKSWYDVVEMWRNVRI
jgi:GWxTD domain-containing protein